MAYPSYVGCDLARSINRIRHPLYCPPYTRTELNSKFSAKAVIRAAGTLGDSMGDVAGIAMGSATYQKALEDDLIEFVRPSEGSITMPTFRGLAVVVDDGMPNDGAGVYESVLFGMGAVAFGTAAPVHSPGTEMERIAAAGQGGGQDVLHSRVVAAMAPAGYSFTDTSVAGESPTLAELAMAANWQRTAGTERKAVPLAFLRHKL